jgi:hypothetical protein
MIEDWNESTWTRATMEQSALHERAQTDRMAEDDVCWQFVDLPNRHRSVTLLTEKEVSRSWSRMFATHEIELATFDRAEQLLEELRPESPLRHRLTVELDELRTRHSRQLGAAVEQRCS